jgi:SAM-dependent methyltransferase
MTDVTRDANGFSAVYRSAGIYNAVLLPHYYSGADDVDLVVRLLTEHYGLPRRHLSIAEFGCGTGRVTARLAPYARRLVAVDSSPVMLGTFHRLFPQIETRCLDTREAVAQMLDDGLAGSVDVVGAFWSLSYPLGDCFETLTHDGIRPVPDRAVARRQAEQFVRNLVRLIARNGHLVVLFFDSETREQRLVTRAWEKIAPFPRGGRGYTLQILLEGLRASEDRGEGFLTHTRTSGVAVAQSRDRARAWFNQVHFKDLSELVNDPEVQADVAMFVEEHTQPSGEVILPSGAHLIDFQVTRDPRHHLPRSR